MKITIELDKATSQTLETLTQALVKLADAQAVIAGRYTGLKKAQEEPQPSSPNNNPPKTEKPEIEAEDLPKIDFAARVPKKEPVKAEPAKAEEPVDEVVEEEPVDEVVEEEPTPQKKATGDEEKKAYALADIRKRVVDLAAQGKKDAVKKVVEKYAAKVSDIPADKYEDVMEELEGLLLDVYVQKMDKK